jgi:hypothetical protein
MSNKQFEWTDELVKEFMIYYSEIDSVVDGVDPILKEAQKFKQDWEKRNPPISPSPLFRTEDGVDIYEGGEVWCVSLVQQSYGLSKTTARPELAPPPVYFKYFANRYNAERYVLLNKPMLTMKEVLDAYPVNTGEYCDFVERLTTLAKAKL